MNKHLSFYLMIAASLSVSLSGQVISEPSERSQLLDDMQTVMGNTDRESVNFAGVQSPFHEKVEPEEPERTSTIEKDKAPATSLSDSTALRLIGQRFKPLGSLVLGNRGILQLANGETIEQGETFNAEIQGRSYPVLIEEVTRNHYRLRLGTATIDKSFLKGDGD